MIHQTRKSVSPGNTEKGSEEMREFSEAVRYTVFLNPYPGECFVRCPRCEQNTHERKRILVVQLGSHLVAPAMVTCRFCAHCDLLIADQHDVAESLRQTLPPEEQENIGTEMNVIGTLDRSLLPRVEIEEVSPEEAMLAFRPIRDQVHFEMIMDEAGEMQLVEHKLSPPAMGEDIPVPDRAKVQALPLVDETWQVSAMQLTTWITEEEDQPYRPYLILVVSTAGPFIVYQQLLKTKPSLADVRDGLFRSMGYPGAGSGEPRRPTLLVFKESALADALSPEMAALEIQCTTGRTLELDDVLASLDYYLSGGHVPIPGLLDNPRVKPEQVGEFFAAAAEFYRGAPWQWMLDEDLVAVRYPARDGEWRFASVMGNAGLEFGLAVFEDLYDYDMLATTPPEAAFGMMTYRSVTFDDVTALPFPDLDALEQYGWEIAAEDAYPIPMTVTEDEELLRPGPEELEWYTVALRATIAFCQQYWPDDIDYVPEPVSTTLTVPLAGRQVPVELRYPADLAMNES